MKVKISGETLTYIIIIVIIGLFVLNLKTVYNFFDELKTGHLFKKPNIATKADDVENKTPVKEYVIVKPNADLLSTCTLSEEVNTSDTKSVKVDIYGNNEYVSSLEQTISYSGLSEEFTNYIYSESKKFTDLKNSNINLNGFSVVHKISGTTSLDSSVVIDLSKAKVGSVVSNNSSIFYLNGELNMKVSDLVKEYTEGGFTCE